MQTLDRLKSRPFFALFEADHKEELDKIVADGNWNLTYVQHTFQVGFLYYRKLISVR